MQKKLKIEKNTCNIKEHHVKIATVVTLIA